MTQHFVKLLKSNIRFLFFFIFLYTSATIYLGSYIESYEIIYSSMVMGEYIMPGVNDFYTTSPQLFTLGFLSNISNFFNAEINFFGWYFVFINFSSLYLLYILVHKFTSINNIKRGLGLYIVLLLIILDNTLNLSSTRIAMIGCFNILLISWCCNASKNKVLLIFILFYSILISLFRFEVVLLFSFLIMVLSLTILKKNPYIMILPIITSIFFMIFYNFYGVEKGSEPNKIFYYFEHQALFNNNNLPPNYYQLKEIGIENIQDDKVLKESLKFSSF